MKSGAVCLSLAAPFADSQSGTLVTVRRTQSHIVAQLNVYASECPSASGFQCSRWVQVRGPGRTRRGPALAGDCCSEGAVIIEIVERLAAGASGCRCAAGLLLAEAAWVHSAGASLPRVSYVCGDVVGLAFR